MSRAVARFRRANALLPAVIPNLWEVIVVGSLESQMTISTFYYADGGAAMAANQELLIANAWVTANGVAYRAALSADWLGVLVKCQSISSPTRMPISTSIAGNNGTGPAGHEPTTVAGICTRQSGVKGQCGRGRVMVPAVPTSWVTGSTITLAAGTTAYSNFAAMMITAFVVGAATYTPQIYSKGTRVSKVPGASPVISTSYRTLLGTVRRRRVGKGK